MNIDLHIHSTASDGSLTPAQLIAHASRQRLAAIAITDHDTVAGVLEAEATTFPPGLEFISGVEISTAAPEGFPCHGSLHLLGYGIDPEHRRLQNALKRLQNARKDRTPRIIAKLNHLGIGITLEALETAVGDAQIGRPHIANWLVNNGVARDVEDAFARYLGVGRPGYADKYRIDCEAAIQLIRSAGGVPVLAHPALITPCGTWPLEELVATLKNAGLLGLEAYYPEHTLIQTQTYLAWAEHFDLVATGGSDFHGNVKPGVQLGLAGGDFHVPYRCFSTLQQRIQRLHAANDATFGTRE